MSDVMTADRPTGSLPTTLHGLNRGLDFLVRSCALIAAGGVVVILLALVREIVGRYLFNAPTIWVDELSGYVAAGVTFLGAAYALRNGDLVAMTLVSERLPARWRHAALALGLVVSAIVLAVVIYYVGIYVLDTHAGQVRSNSTWQVPLWIPRAVMLAGLVLLFLETVRQILLEVARSLRGRGEV